MDQGSPSCCAPNRLVAVVLISGGGNPVSACRLNDVPVWLVHGRKDDVIPVEESELLTTYEDPEFYRWLLTQERKPSRRN